MPQKSLSHATVRLRAGDGLNEPHDAASAALAADGPLKVDSRKTDLYETRCKKRPEQVRLTALVSAARLRADVFLVPL
jgi:hypothetical protein